MTNKNIIKGKKNDEIKSVSTYQQEIELGDTKEWKKRLKGMIM